MAKAPDRLERGLRFGCGTLFGLALGLPLVVESLARDGPWLLMGLGVVAGFTVLCGVLARTQGDEFWWSLRERWWR